MIEVQEIKFLNKKENNTSISPNIPSNERSLMRERHRSSVARHNERNYGIGMLKLWYTMVKDLTVEFLTFLTAITSTAPRNIFFRVK